MVIFFERSAVAAALAGATGARPTAGAHPAGSVRRADRRPPARPRRRQARLRRRPRHRRPRRPPEVPSEPPQHDAPRGGRRARGGRRVLDARPDARSARRPTKLSHVRSRRSRASLKAAEAELATNEKAKARLQGQLHAGGPARQGRPGRRRRPLAAGPAQLGRRAAARSTSARSRSAAARARPRPPRRKGAAHRGADAAPGATTVGTAGFAQMPFTFSFKGCFFSLGDFLQAPGPLRRGQAAAHGRHGPPDGARHDLAAPRRDGLPEHARPDRRDHLPAAGDAGPHGRRDRGRAPAPRRAPRPPPRPRPPRPPPTPSTPTAAIGATR